VSEDNELMPSVGLMKTDRIMPLRSGTHALGRTFFNDAPQKRPGIFQHQGRVTVFYLYSSKNSDTMPYEVVAH
jgi:hypothetical protein